MLRDLARLVSALVWWLPTGSSITLCLLHVLKTCDRFAAYPRLYVIQPIA